MQQIYFCIHWYAVSSYMTLQTPLNNIHSLDIFQVRPADLLYGDVVGECLAYCSDCSIYSTAYIGIFLIMDREVLREVILSFEWFFPNLTGIHTFFCVSHLANKVQQVASPSHWRILLPAVMTCFYRHGRVHYMMRVWILSSSHTGNMWKHVLMSCLSGLL